MNAQEHPEFDQEQHNLERTLEALDALLDEINQFNPAAGAERAGEAPVVDYRAKAHLLQGAYSSPYFGRIDFVPQDSEQPETYYFGKIGFRHHGQQIIDWQAPVARLFYMAGRGYVSYTAPGGQQSGAVLLKRNLGIQSQHLFTIVDEFDARKTDHAAEVMIPAPPEQSLRHILRDRSEAHLSEIVASIQPHQYELIQASPNQVLLIQGVAGSGKTSVALHRLAFLLYPANGSGFQPRRCIIFGPTRLFLNYVSLVLPDLGVDEITQTTFAEWALEQMGQTGYQLSDRVMEALLNPAASQEEKVGLYRRSQYKNSQRMAQLLERYVERRRKASFPAEGLTFGEVGPMKVSVSLTGAELAKAYGSFVNLPLKRHRERFLETLRMYLVGHYDHNVTQQSKQVGAPTDQLVEQVTNARQEAEKLDRLAASIREIRQGEFDAQATAGALENGAAGLRQLAGYYQQQVNLALAQMERQRAEALATDESHESSVKRKATLKRLEEDLVRAIEPYCPALNPILEYYSLLGNRSLLAELGHDLFAPAELEQLHQPQPPAANVMDLSDLPAAHYLHTLMHGVPVALYDHILVDEAQDVSRLQFNTLRRFSRNGSFTILGDLSQGIYAYRGISSWNEVKEALSDLTYNYQEIKKAYRTTYEIMTFANMVLQALGSRGQPVVLAEPFERHGEPPGLHPLEGEAQISIAVATVARQIQDAGYRQIAIIGKTIEFCLQLAEALKRVGFTEFEVALTPDFDYQGGVVIMPISSAKGLEFEAVLVVGADDATYPATAFDGRLLFTALTRALHILHIFWVGKVAWHLEGAIRQNQPALSQPLTATG